MEPLSKLKLRLWPQTEFNDDLLHDILDRAESFIKNYCNINEVPTGLLEAQLGIAVMLYTRMGDEGKGETSEGGRQISYQALLNEDTRSQLNAHRKMRR